jgi:muramoyltetrapeptide carboxypeptidase
MITPKRLKSGEKVAVVSPGEFITDEDRFSKGVDWLSKHFKVRIMPHARDRWNYSAGKPEDRAKDINDAFSDPNIRAIFCTTGGYTTSQILPFLNYSTIKNNPKIVVGLSDGATLINAINAKTGLETYHGPMVMYGIADIGPHSEYPTKGRVTEASLLETLVNGDMVDFKRYDAQNQIQFLKPGKVISPSFGGYLSCVQSLIGTEYMPTSKGKIFFWEVVDELHTVEMQLDAFKLAGILGNISGMVIGYTGACKESEYPDIDYKIKDMVIEKTKEFDYPIVSAPLFGHYIENVTFPIGARYEIDSDKKILRQTMHGAK